jgi:hypothetical protein
MCFKPTLPHRWCENVDVFQTQTSSPMTWKLRWVSCQTSSPTTVALVVHWPSCDLKLSQYSSFLESFLHALGTSSLSDHRNLSFAHRGAQHLTPNPLNTRSRTHLTIQGSCWCYLKWKLRREFTLSSFGFNLWQFTWASMLFAVETSLTIQLFSWKLGNCIWVHVEQLFNNINNPLSLRETQTFRGEGRNLEVFRSSVRKFKLETHEFSCRRWGSLNLKHDRVFKILNLNSRRTATSP